MCGARAEDAKHFGVVGTRESAIGSQRLKGHNIVGTLSTRTRNWRTQMLNSSARSLFFLLTALIFLNFRCLSHRSFLYSLFSILYSLFSIPSLSLSLRLVSSLLLLLLLLLLLPLLLPLPLSLSLSLSSPLLISAISCLPPLSSQLLHFSHLYRLLPL